MISAPALEPSEPEEEQSWRPGRPVSPSSRAATRRWYGTPTLIIDAAAATLFTVGGIWMDEGLGPIIALGVPAYVLGGPIVHASHGNWGRSAGSLLLRAGAPLLGAIFGASMCVRESGDCIEGVITFGAVGMVTAAVLDLSLLHWESSAKAPSPAGLGAFAPQLAFDRHGLRLGAAGSF
jgi:hypothetical protein